MAELDQEARDLARDSFAHDMAKHQREIRGEIPTPAANEQLAAETLNRFENQQAEAKPEPSAPADETATDAHMADVERRAKEKGWKVLRAPEGGIVLPASAATRIAAERIDARLQLLLSKVERGPLGQPSWHERVLAVIRTRMVDPDRARLELFQLLEDSSTTFGDWKAEPEKKLIFT